MTTPEITGLKQTPATHNLQTKLPDVITQDITAKDLPDLKRMFESNLDFFAEGGIYADDLYTMIEQEVSSEHASPHQRIGIWKGENLVGYVSVVPSERHTAEHEVEVAYLVDSRYARQGIASAAVEAIVDDEIEKGNHVIAEVENRNKASQKMLGKLGFELTAEQNGRHVYSHGGLSIDEMMHRLGM